MNLLYMYAERLPNGGKAWRTSNVACDATAATPH